MINFILPGIFPARAFIATRNLRIGDSSFKLTGDGVALINTIATDPNTGTETNQQSTVKLKT